MIQKGKKMQISDSGITVSVIIPVYNAEKYIKRAVQSVQRQSLPQKQIEIILIDDGSKDGSPAICDQLGKQHSNIRVFHQENKGVSAARNKGIDEARGKYLAYLDADDRLSKETLKNVAAFFDRHYEETDIVGYSLVECFPGGGQEFHYRDRILKETKIEKVGLVPVNLTTVNVFVKNLNEANIRFREDMQFHEDIDYALRAAAENGTFGYVKEACYYYERGTGSVTDTVGNAEYFFGPSTEMYERWMSDYRENTEVLRYAKLTIINDLAWNIRKISKIKEGQNLNIESEYVGRIIRIMAQIDEEMIWEHPALEKEEKLLLAAMNHSSKEQTAHPKFSRQPVRLEFLHIKNDCLLLEGLTQTYGTTGEGCSFLLKVNGKEVPCDTYRREKEDRYFSGRMILKGIGFKGKILLNPAVSCYEISVEQVIQGGVYPRKQLIYGKFFPLSVYTTAYYHREGWVLTHTCDMDKLIVTPENHYMKIKHEYLFLRELWKKNRIGGRKAVIVRIIYHLLKKQKRKQVWLISDRIMKAGDNGEALYRFLMKFHKKEYRLYFLLNKKSLDYEKIKQIGKVIPFYSPQHKLLHLLCDYNISSQADMYNINPFYGYHDGYKDLLADNKFVFLQHGVIKDDLSDWLEKPNRNLFGFVTSAAPEYRSVLYGAYGYNETEVWLTGLPRFDNLSNKRSNKKQITIMPTWRKYLMGQPERETAGRELKKDFYDSDFLRFYNNLLNHPRLLVKAKEADYSIVFFPHPMLQKSLSAFQKNKQVHLAGSEQSYQQIYSESSLIVTDYSSAIFDFAYMEKPIIYTQFDREEFFSGEHVYQKGYFDYEKDGFGEVEYDLESTVDRIIEYMENGCIMKEQYRERVRKFFAFHDKNNCQRVYEKLIKMSE